VQSATSVRLAADALHLAGDGVQFTSTGEMTVSAVDTASASFTGYDVLVRYLSIYRSIVIFLFRSLSPVRVNINQ